MVMNLDKCIGCHTCSVTCKQAWTNRAGVEYVWFNNVETRPGQGYPRRYEDQERWRGGWELQPARAAEAARPAAGSASCHHLLQPRAAGDQGLLRALDLRLREPHRRAAGRRLPGGPAAVAAQRQADEGRVERQLGRRPRRRAETWPTSTRSWSRCAEASDKVKLEFEQTFMFYLPRICEHCLNPSCVASCPSGAMYKRAEDGIVLVDQDQCRGWRMCVTGCPYKKVYFNHRPARPRSARSATRASRSACRRCARRPASAGCATSAWSSTTPTGSARPRRSPTSRTLRGAARRVPRPARPAVIAGGPARRASPTTGWRRPGARRCTRWPRSTGSRCRCTRSTGRCRWSGTSRRCPRWSTR